MTRISNFALKIKGGGRKGGTCEVLRPCHPPPPKKEKNLERAPYRFMTNKNFMKEVKIKVEFSGFSQKAFTKMEQF